MHLNLNERTNKNRELGKGTVNIAILVFSLV